MMEISDMPSKKKNDWVHINIGKPSKINHHTYTILFTAANSYTIESSNSISKPHRFKEYYGKNRQNKIRVDKLGLLRI